MSKELITKLRDTASKGISVWGDLQIEAADAIEAQETKIALQKGLIDGLLIVKREIANERETLAARVAELEDELGSSTVYTLNELQAKICGLAGERDRLAVLRQAIAQPEQVPAWQDISIALPATGIPVLADIGEKYPLRACWIAKFTQEIGASDFNGDDDYDEATDTAYWPEGWYELNRFEETHWFVDVPVKNWAPLPAAPEVKP